MSEQFQPSPDGSHPELVELLVDEIAARGRISFARFMQLALAHPQFGYYAASKERAGYQGDFLTAPETHPIFGVVVARQIVEFWKQLGCPQHLAIREFGAGRGTLARHVLTALSDPQPGSLSTVNYQLIDLAASPEARPVSELEPFEGVVLANEFLDALPFHRLIVEQGELREIYTALSEGQFVDEVGPPSKAIAGSVPLPEGLAEGQRIEVAPQRQEWIRSLGSSLERGFVLIFDYGYHQPDIYDVSRFPRGSLKTYRHHDVGEDPYAHVGMQDITAHVDFTAIETAARQAGFQAADTITQSQFVIMRNIEQDLLQIQSNASEPEQYLAARAAVFELLNPRGLGRFRVMALAKNIDVHARNAAGFVWR